MANCIFCNTKIEKGTGKMFVFKTGKVIHFCSSKCEKNMLKLNRKSRNLKWASKKPVE